MAAAAGAVVVGFVVAFVAADGDRGNLAEWAQAIGTALAFAATFGLLLHEIWLRKAAERKAKRARLTVRLETWSVPSSGMAGVSHDFAVVIENLGPGDAWDVDMDTENVYPRDAGSGLPLGVLLPGERHQMDVVYSPMTAAPRVKLRWRDAEGNRERHRVLMPVSRH